MWSLTRKFNSIMKTLTIEQIVDETVAFYAENPRERRSGIWGTSNVNLTTCLYNGPDGKHCALGRCMIPELKSLGDKLEVNEKDAESLFEQYGCDNALQPQYRGHSKYFWLELQYLHDSDLYWTETGISPIGLQKADFIKKKFGSISGITLK